jgi:hypothetical protein
MARLAREALADASSVVGLGTPYAAALLADTVRRGDLHDFEEAAVGSLLQAAGNLLEWAAWLLERAKARRREKGAKPPWTISPTAFTLTPNRDTFGRRTTWGTASRPT